MALKKGVGKAGSDGVSFTFTSQKLELPKNLRGFYEWTNDLI